MLIKRLLPIIILILLSVAVSALTQLSDCKTSGWVSGETYELTSDVNIDSGLEDQCFEIDNASVTLDCKGYRITKSWFGTTWGVRVLEHDSVTIKNCRISGLHYGVRLEGSTNSVVRNVSVHNSTWDSIFILGGTGLTIEDSYINDSGTNGIHLLGTNSSTVQRNRVDTSVVGIKIEDSKFNDIQYNNASNNPGALGIDIDESFNNTIRYNNASGNDANLYVTGAASVYNDFYGNRLENAVLSSYGAGALFVLGTNNNDFYENTVYNNQQGGIGILYNSPSNIIRDNNISGNALGIQIGGPSYGTNNGNYIYRNFLSNTANAYDFDTNHWNVTSVGNYWSDYSSGNNKSVAQGANIDYFPHKVTGFKRTNPVSTNFATEHGTTNFATLSNLTSITLTLATADVSVTWQNKVYANNLDFDNNVVMGVGYVSLDSANLDQTLETPADIGMTVNGCPATIYYSSTHQTSLQDIKSNGQVCNTGTTPACTNINCNGNTLTFTVEHFDGYGGDGSGIVPEFSTWAMILALTITVMGFFFMRNRY